MDRQDVGILINSTPKYYYLLPLQLTLLRRYASQLKWPVFFATEVPNHPISQQIAKEFQATLLSLKSEAAGFLESRQAALRLLPPNITYVLPLQEDFLLDRSPDEKALVDALFVLDTDRHISSIRLNPCPGPHETDVLYTKEKEWRILGQKNAYIFTYQATLWRRLDLQMYWDALLTQMVKDFARNKPLSEQDKRYLALTSNIGENDYGQRVLRQTLPDTLHLSCPRRGPWSNAVYLCPWPYRPTAVVRGRLEPFAEELFQREGVKFEKPEGNIVM